MLPEANKPAGASHETMSLFLRQLQYVHFLHMPVSNPSRYPQKYYLWKFLILLSYKTNKIYLEANL